MTAADPAELAVRVMLAEYEQVKAEQRHRIGYRDSLVYAVLVAYAAVASATATRGPGYLLLAPPVALLLGWARLQADIMVSEVSRYVGGKLAPALAGLIPADVALLDWDVPGGMPDPARPWRKALQWGCDLIGYGVLPLAGLVVLWGSGQGWPALSVSAVEAAALGVLSVEIARAADIGRIRRWGGGR